MLVGGKGDETAQPRVDLPKRRPRWSTRSCYLTLAMRRRRASWRPSATKPLRGSGLVAGSSGLYGIRTPGQLICPAAFPLTTGTPLICAMAGEGVQKTPHPPLFVTSVDESSSPTLVS